MNPVKVVLQDMPCSIRAFTVRCFDDGQQWFTVIVNARLSCAEREQAYVHEINHINKGDFNAVQVVNALEAERHQF